tara:strand:+ start:286 stop:546 length:261 start_codon:yes stop_codon:yes gene_type:complete
MSKKKKFLLENIERNLEDIKKAKEANKAVIKIRELILQFENGYFTECEFANQMADITLCDPNFKTLTLLESCQHTLIVSKEIIEKS